MITFALVSPTETGRNGKVGTRRARRSALVHSCGSTSSLSLVQFTNAIEYIEWKISNLRIGPRKVSLRRKNVSLSSSAHNGRVLRSGSGSEIGRRRKMSETFSVLCLTQDSNRHCYRCPYSPLFSPIFRASPRLFSFPRSVLGARTAAAAE